MRTPKAWILHCDGGVDDRAEELHQSRGKFEAPVMHRLMGEKFSYMELMDVLDIPRMPTHKAHAQTPAYQSVKSTKYKRYILV